MTSLSASPAADALAATYALISSSIVRGCDAGEPCGDATLVFPLPTGRTGIVVLDVAGHGTARAPIAAALVDEITASLELDGSPAIALGRAERLLCAYDDEFPYAVAFVALVRPVSRSVVYASAGFDAAFTLGDDGRIRHLPPTAAMLGIALAKDACDAAFTLGPTETLVIATDGISDSRPAGSSDFFGADRTALAITRARRAGTDPARAVFEAARTHEGAVQADDDAVLVARIQPSCRRRYPSKEIVHAPDHRRRSGRFVPVGA